MKIALGCDHGGLNLKNEILNYLKEEGMEELYYNVEHPLIGVLSSMEVVGFNVNEEKFSDETKELAISLKAVYHKDFSREEIIKRFIEILEENIADILELEK